MANFTEKSQNIFDKSNVSSMFLTGRSYAEKKEIKFNISNRRRNFDPFELNNKHNQNELIINDCLSDADPNDFGYFSVPGCNIVVKEIKEEENYEGLIIRPRSDFGKILLKNAKEQADSSKMNIATPNLIRHLNHLKHELNPIKTQIRNLKNLFEHFAQQAENDYNTFDVPNPWMNLNEKRDKYDIRNTENTLMRKKQKEEMKKGEFEKVVDLNYNYQKWKDRYEVLLVRSLKRKIEFFENECNGVKSIKITSSDSYKKLRTFYKEKLEKTFEPTLKPDINYGLKFEQISDSVLAMLKIKSISCLTHFIKDIETEIDDKPKEDKKGGLIDTGKKLNNHLFWKKKLSELVNIWELSQSNGILLKFPLKYLTLKNYFSNRSERRQSGLNSGGSGQETPNFIKELIKSLLGLHQSSNVPRSIFMPGEIISILFEILIAALILYSIFSIPIVEFIGYKNDVMTIAEKFVDMIFYIEIITKFRKVFRDKSNNYEYSIDKMMWNYIKGTFLLDILSTFPWYFFFLQNKSAYSNIKKWVMCFKIVRIFKLFPFFRMLESLKFANYVRLFRLVFLFFFFSHWMGSFLYAYIDLSIDYTSMIPQCYEGDLIQTKSALTYTCRYIISFYDAAYIIPGQYVSNMQGINQLNPSGEYVILIIQYLIGQVLAAYIFGGMASVVRNLNQGQNFFTNKMDMLNEHMMFYSVDDYTMKDVKIYFDYMWQRHKDVIYGKTHFDLLSNSLREKFERLNLPGNEYLLAQFYQLTSNNNNKLIGNILLNLNKLILFPYEILFEKGTVIRGIYIVLNGDVELNEGKGTGEINQKNINVDNKINQKEYVDYAEILRLTEEDNLNGVPPNMNKNVNKSIVFPLISALIKTGRIYQRCYSEHFTDLLYLPIKSFDEMIYYFPKEMHILKHNKMKECRDTALFQNLDTFKIICKHSSRSVGKYYEKNYNLENIWVPIPIPISQRKISSNYVKGFTKKVRSLWREILIQGDLSICLNAVTIPPLLKKNKENNEDSKIRNGKIDIIKGLSGKIDKQCFDLLNIFKFIEE